MIIFSYVVLCFMLLKRILHECIYTVPNLLANAHSQYTYGGYTLIQLDA